MALTDNTHPANFAAPGTAAPAAQPEMPPAAGMRLNLLNIETAGGIVRAAAGEVLSKGIEAVQESIKSTRFRSDYEVLAANIDNQVAKGLRFSSIIPILRHQKSGFVAFHALMLEDSAENVVAKNENIGGVPVVIERYPAQAYDSVYVAAVDRTIAQGFPDAKQVINTGCTVVPRGFRWDDKVAVRELTHNAMIACATYIEARQDNFVDMNMVQLGGGEQLQINIQWDKPSTTDYTGLPVRSDVQISCTAVAQQTANNASQNSENNSVTISCVSGFLDLSYEASGPQYQYQVASTPFPHRKYRPRFIITRLENALRMTPAGQLFAIASALPMAQGMTFFRGFQPRKNGKGRDPRDVGAVNIEANLPMPPTNQPDPSGFGKVVDTKSANFSDRELGALISQTMHPELVFSIDVSDAGADTWYNSVFKRAAQGDRNAQNEILRAANTLTGGEFAKLYGNNTFLPVLENTGERVLLGYFLNKEGHREDVRVVDYLYVANALGVSNPKEIANWSDTYDRVLDQPSALRLHSRKTLVRACLDPSVVFTQEGTRCTLNPQFNAMLLAALKEAKTSFRLVDTGITGDFVSQRVGGLFAQAGMQFVRSPVFQAGTSGQGSVTGFTVPMTPGSMF